MPDDVNMTIDQIKRKRVFYLAFSTITLLFLGLLYAFSMFAGPMSSTFGLEKSDVGLTFNIMMIAFCIGCVGGSRIEKLLGIRGSLICSAIMVLAGFVGTSMFGYGSIFAVYLLYGVCAGAGVGIGYNSIIATTNVWFPDKVGFSSGVLMLGFGVSTLLLGNLAVRLIPIVGLSAVFSGIGILAGVITFAYSFVLRKPPANITEVVTGQKSAVAGYDPADDDKILKTPTFFVYWIWAIIIIAIGLATIGSCASDAQLVGLGAEFATMLVGLVSTTNGAARIVMGAIYDKTSVKVAMGLDAFIGVISSACIFGAFATGIGALYVIGALCAGFCYGSIAVIASAFARQRFGAKNYPLNLSITNFAIVFGSLLNVVVQFAVNGSVNRISVFVVLLVLSIVALADVLPFSKMWNRDMLRFEERRTA